MIELQQIEKAYSTRNGEARLWVLRRFTLEIGGGEFLSVVGPSGCGKTTLLKVIAGLEPVNAGSVSVGGKSPVQARQKREFGFVFQNPVLFEWRTVIENVRLPAELFRDGDAFRKAEDYVELVGLQDFRNAYPRQLSGGMQSRVALARALSFHPKILLMDEPFGDLDELTRSQMNLELLRIWKTTRATVVFVTHSISEALFLSDRVVVMSQRPAQVKETLAVSLARPRTLEMTYSSEFGQMAQFLRRQTELGN